MLMYAQTFGKVKATVFSSAQMKNFQQRGTDPKNQTNNKHSTYPCWSCCNLSTFFSLSCEWTCSSSRCNKDSFIKSHHVLFWVWQGKVKKMEQNQPHLRLKKGLIIIYQEVEGGSSEDIICITINFTWSPMRLCNLMIPFHWQLVGTQFCLAPHPTLWSVGNQFPSFPRENHVITPKSSEPLPLERK